MSTGPEARQEPPECASTIDQTEPAAADCPFDLQSLLDRCLGDGEFCRTLMGKFTLRAAEVLAGLDRAANAHSAGEMAGLAHEIKGLAANFSADNLRFWAGALECAVRGGNSAQLRPLVGKVRAETERCIRAVPRMLQRLAESQ